MWGIGLGLSLRLRRHGDEAVFFLDLMPLPLHSLQQIVVRLPHVLLDRGHGSTLGQDRGGLRALATLTQPKFIPLVASVAACLG